MPDPTRSSSHPIWVLTVIRLKEMLREPSAVFWTFVFPVLLAVALGLAFRNRGAEPIVVGVLDGPDAPAYVTALEQHKLVVRRVDGEAARLALRSGKITLLVVPPAVGAPVVLRFDPMRPESRLARAATFDAIERSSGRVDPRPVVDEHITDVGSRYIDFLIPGLIGMNLMSGSMWGIGYVLVNMRVKRLLKRLLATPMRRSHFLLSHGLSRVAILGFELGVMLVFGKLAFHMPIIGSLAVVGLLAVVAALAFAGIGILVSSRAENLQTVGGLMNFAMLPMFILSGVFFSSSNFPDAMQPVIRLLPLTAVNDGLRAVLLDGASLVAVLPNLVVLGAWGVVTFAIGLRVFKWR